ncbi:uncharacterized protein LOC110924982 [Helianthus annuus]|uniref:uncharacterized protein LOC110924982 n=1 Tax=Helianthus annuus TaxID=4232 RepID=UPI000B905BAA|nr:uncharacterized protein LOC110924982 [Helianthus annuus]
MSFLKDIQKDNEVRDKSSAAMQKQLRQLAEDIAQLRRDLGKLPSTTTVNPQHQSSSSATKNARVNQVSVLHSGKVYDNKVGTPPQFVDGVVEEWDENEEEEHEPEPVSPTKANKTTSQETNDKVIENASTKATEKGAGVKTNPFPHALVEPGTKSTKRGPQQEEMWEVFKQVFERHVHPKAGNKFPKKIDLTENVSAVLSGAIPPKLRDPDAPLIPIQVGDFKMIRALLDLGASMSIIPGSLYDQYDFGPLQKADTTLVLADLTLKLPRGIVCDVIVKVEDFYYPVDFLVLDYVSNDKTKQPNVILGRPFLATANALIDCRNGTVDMTFGNRKVQLNVFSRASDSLVSDECFMADIIDECHHHENGVNTTETCVIYDREQAELSECLNEAEKELEVMAIRGDETHLDSSSGKSTRAHRYASEVIIGITSISGAKRTAETPQVRLRGRQYHPSGDHCIKFDKSSRKGIDWGVNGV